MDGPRGAATCHGLYSQPWTLSTKALFKFLHKILWPLWASCTMTYSENFRTDEASGQTGLQEVPGSWCGCWDSWLPTLVSIRQHHFRFSYLKRNPAATGLTTRSWEPMLPPATSVRVPTGPGFFRCPQPPFACFRLTAGGSKTGKYLKTLLQTTPYFIVGV